MQEWSKYNLESTYEIRRFLSILKGIGIIKEFNMYEVIKRIEYKKAEYYTMERAKT